MVAQECLERGVDRSEHEFEGDILVAGGTRALRRDALAAEPEPGAGVGMAGERSA